MIFYLVKSKATKNTALVENVLVDIPLVCINAKLYSVAQVLVILSLIPLGISALAAMTCGLFGVAIYHVLRTKGRRTRMTRSMVRAHCRHQETHDRYNFIVARIYGRTHELIDDKLIHKDYTLFKSV